MRKWTLALCLLASVFFAAPAVAQEKPKDGYTNAGAEHTVAERTLVDFRGKLMLAFSFVFLLVIFYLVQSYRKNAKLAEDLEFLSERIDHLQAPGKSAPAGRGSSITSD